jgi:hypothetical protein
MYLEMFTHLRFTIVRQLEPNYKTENMDIPKGQLVRTKLQAANKAPNFYEVSQANNVPGKLLLFVT